MLSNGFRQNFFDTIRVLAQSVFVGRVSIIDLTYVFAGRIGLKDDIKNEPKKLGRCSWIE